MTRVSWIQIGFIVLGVLLMVGGDRLGIPTLLHAGLALIGLGFIVGGGEAIVTRRYALQRRGFSDATYYGPGAVLYGIVLVWIGVWVISVAGVLFLDVGQAVFRSVIRRPGFVMVNVAVVLFASSGVILSGAIETRPGPEAGWFLRLISVVFRSIPAMVMLLLGVALLGLGALEIVAPATFDQMGGGFLELLFREPS